MIFNYLLKPRRSALVLCLAAMLGGCTAEGASSIATPREPSRASTESLAAARAGGASTEQLVILAKGAVPSFEDYQAAINRSIACIDEAGITTMPPMWSTQRGITFLRFGVGVSSVGRTDAQTGDVVVACIDSNSRWVEEAWENQPWADAAEQRRLEALRPSLVACLERGGNKIDDDASLIGVLQMAEERAKEIGAVEQGKLVDCAAEVGA